MKGRATRRWPASALTSVMACLLAIGLARAEEPAKPATATGAAHPALFTAVDSNYSVPITTLRELRQRELFRSTIRQQYDFSCGSAALATLLTYHYRHPVNEEAVFRVMYEHGDQQRIQAQGFSLLDIKRYLETNGYNADGFEVTLDQLAEAKIPAIALIRENGYNHFVVIKGMQQNRLLIGDPSSGTRIVERKAFEELWKVRILFVIRSHNDVAAFNDASQWIIRRPAPINDAMLRDSTSTAVLMRPGRNEF